MSDFGVEPPLSGDSGIESAPESPDQLAPPDIKGYEILGLIGHGGMGAVWRGRQKSPQREVAIKFMGASVFGSERARARFEREIDILARLNHPAIASVLESGVESGEYYYTMQLIEGRHLDDHVGANELGLRETLELFAEACEAVGFAHQKGVIHRDLKPSNIVVDDDGRPHIVDFGLAKDILTGSETMTVSQDGSVTGTPAFMAPEQALGDAAAIDTRTDVYGLGVILYLLLTGDYPHDPTGTELQVRQRIADREFRDPRKIGRPVDRELAAILATALAKKPSERYTNAGDLADDVRRYLNGETIRARPLTVGYFLRKRMWRHRARVAVAMLVLAALSATAVFAYVRVTQERNQARRHAERAERSLYANRIALAQQALEDLDVARAREILADCPPRYRHWEWRRLQYLADQSVAATQCPAGTALGVAVTADQRVLVVMQSGRLFIWQPETGQTRLAAQAVDGPLRRAIFGEAGRRLLTFDREQLALHRIRDVEALWSTRMTDALTDLAMSDDGRWVAAVVGHDRLKLFDTSTPAAVLDRRFDQPITAVAVANTGVVAAAAGGGVLVADPERPDAAATLPIGRPRIESLTITQDATALAAVQRGGALIAWDLGNSSRYGTRIEEGIVRAAFVAERRVVVTSTSGAIYRWGFTGDKSPQRLLGHATQVRTLAASPDGRSFATVDIGGGVRFWRGDEPVDGRVPLHESDAGIACLAADPRTDRLAIGHFNGEVTFASLTNPGPGEKVARVSQAAASLALHPDGEIAVCGGGGLWIVRPDAPSSKRLVQLAEGRYYNARFAESGSLMALNQSDQQVEVWDPASKQRLWHRPALVATLLPATDMVLTSDPKSPHTLIAYHLSDGRMARRLSGHEAEIVAIVAARSADRAVSRDSEGLYCCWRLTTGEREGAWRAPEGQTSRPLLLSPDGTRLFRLDNVLELRNPISGAAYFAESLPGDSKIHYGRLLANERTEIVTCESQVVHRWSTRGDSRLTVHQPDQ